MYYKFSLLYVLLYFALGSIYPLLSRYLEEINLTGSQIGMITATGSFVLIFAQPLWGFFCDKTQKTKKILKGTILVAAVLMFFMSFFENFYLLLVGFALIYFFQGANGPLTDSLALSYVAKNNTSFGKIRQWGAVGFAVAVFISGMISEIVGLKVIFYLYFLAYTISLLFIDFLPEEKVVISTGMKKGMKQLLKKPQYTLLLISALLIFGPINGNNIYFALLAKDLGGSLTGVGIAFLLFAGSEAPFMLISNKIIKKLGLINTIVFSAVISAGRWFWYSTGPNYNYILYLFVLQGISVGLFIVASAQYVKENSPEELKVTAMTLFTALALGLGSIISKLFGGIIIDYFDILKAYYFFGWGTVAGLVPLLFIKYRYDGETK
ncbi:MAG: MFS transporter [Clostridiaceae bacterium]|nr:MFS transporter [Clostridiaceae bacterium]